MSMTSEDMRRLWAQLMWLPSLGAARLMTVLGIWNWWDELDETVILGALPSAEDLTTLREMGVRGTVNMCAESRGHVAHLADLGLEQLWLPTVDYTPPSEPDVRRAIGFLRRFRARGERVYLHCKAGQGRSGLVAVCYFMAEHGLPLNEAFARVKSAHRQLDGGILRREVVRAIEAAIRRGERLA